MELLMLNTGWIVLEEGTFLEYGSIACNFCNYMRKQEKLHYADEKKISKKYSNSKSERIKRIKELEKKYPDLFNKDTYSLYEMIEFHAFELAGPKGSYKPLEKITDNEDIQAAKKIQELVRAQGWASFPDDAMLNIADLYLIRMFKNPENKMFSFRPCFYNGKWYLAVQDDRPNSVSILMLDFMMMRKCQHYFRYCREFDCQNIFITKDNRKKYCPICSANRSKIADTERKYKVRYNDKLTKNYLRNSEKFSQEEIITYSDESDYYWSKVSGNLTQNLKKYSANIETKEQYSEWCLKKHKEFKEIAKTRTKKY